MSEEPSLYCMSVLERNKYWLEKKQKKIESEKEKKQEKLMKECTFEPIIYSRVPQVYQKYSRSQKETSLLNTKCNLEPTLTEVRQISSYEIQQALRAEVNYKDHRRV